MAGPIEGDDRRALVLRQNALCEALRRAVVPMPAEAMPEKDDPAGYVVLPLVELAADAAVLRVDGEILFCHGRCLHFVTGPL